MKAFRLAAGFTLILGLTGCGGSNQATVTAKVMPDVVGRKLDVALSDIKSAGFEDKVEVVGGGAFGVVAESNWQVCHQLPAAGQSLTAAPRLTVDRSCADGATASTTASTQTPPVPSKSSATSPPKAEQILTAANSSDLAALLTERDNCSDTVRRFASTYRGRTISFDGNIAAMSNHGAYKTRFDILVVPGDFSKTSQVGPTFQFRDVNIVLDLHLVGSNIPDSLRQGANLHVDAQVADYENSSCLFLLTPVSTRVR